MSPSRRWGERRTYGELKRNSRGQGQPAPDRSPQKENQRPGERPEAARQVDLDIHGYRDTRFHEIALGSRRAASHQGCGISAPRYGLTAVRGCIGPVVPGRPGFTGIGLAGGASTLALSDDPPCIPGKPPPRGRPGVGVQVISNKHVAKSSLVLFHVVLFLFWANAKPQLDCLSPAGRLHAVFGDRLSEAGIRASVRFSREH